MNQQGLHKADILCQRDVDFCRAPLFGMYLDVCCPDHAVRDDVLVGYMVFFHYRQHVLNGAGNLMVGQGCFECVTLELDANRAIVAMLACRS